MKVNNDEPIITKYPDGTSYVKAPPYSAPRAFEFRVNSYEDLWHLNQLVDAWNHSNVRQPVITIPNLIDAQADRRFGKNESRGLKLVCDFLNGMDAKFKIFHPHNAEVVEALIDDVEIIDNEKFIRDVLKKIYPIPNVNDPHGTELYKRNREMWDSLILMSSDAGGFKPLVKLCDKLNWQGGMFSASKARSWTPDGTKFVQQINKKDFEGKDILVIDDISVYGGTFKGLSKLLRERNVGKLYLAVSHMTVKNLGDDPVTNYFDQVFITNSKFDNYGVTGDHISMGIHEFEQPENLTIIKQFKE